MAKFVEMHVQEARKLADCLEAETAESEADRLKQELDRLKQELGQTQGERLRQEAGGGSDPSFEAGVGSDPR